MDATVYEQAAAVCRVQVFEAGTVRITRGGLKEHGRADSALRDLLLGRQITFVESPHKTHLKEHAGLLDDVEHSARL